SWGSKRLSINFMLFTFSASTIPACLAFNIDTRNPEVFLGEPGDFFGYRVLQYLNKSSNNKGIVVTAPLRLNGSGGIYQPDQNKWFNPSEDLQSNKTVVKHLGLSIAADSSGSRFTVCSPSLVHECNENSYLNSICYELSDQFREISSFRPAYQECTKKTVDLVFLFDGSASLTQNEFNRNKDFIVEIMNSLKNMSIKFAAVQFSRTVQKVFDFNDYEAGRALDKLKKENHLKSLTNTHRAIEFVLDEIFDNKAAGASPDATKVLILITDGDPSDTDKNKIIKKYDEKNIIRLVIGIKDAKLDKFRAIASEPKNKNAFKIENYDGLTGVLENFQKDIFVMEGSKVAQAGNLTDEMSQSGFSAVFNKDTLILGSVGTNSWRGSLQERRDKMETQIEDQEMEMDSYMGYSVSVGERGGVSLYFTGAPRFQHTGQVVLFKQNSNNWTTAQRITGDQIGSYFGAELCSVDINSDGDTDFLLVGAPTFYQPQEKKEGQIYIYSLTDELQLKSELNVTGPSMGRFGTTISSLADLNGDGLRDVAVGAPLEDDNRGAVYIYLGDRHRGIRSAFSQRITGKEVTPGIKFFGQAINGAIDLGGNGLPDIVIGSQGAAVVFRYQNSPIFDVMAHLTFQPKEINTEIFDCLGTDENLPMVTLTACFEMVKVTKSKQEAVRSGLNITFTLAVDPMRQKHRGVFSQTDKTARSLTSTYEMLDETACFNFSIYMHECVSNLLSPISIKFNFSQADNETAATTLNVDSKRQSVVEVPFKKACRKNDTCIAELDVDFSFMTTQLLVAEDAYFTVSIKLANHGDDSYNTMLTMHYPPGLSFRRMTSSRSTPHKCLDLEGVLDKTVCGVSLPLFRSRSSATFESSFYVMHDFEWDDSISMTIDANSDNQDSNRTSVLTKNIPVQFEIKMILTVKQDSTTYLNFTTEDTAPKEMGITYRIDNFGFKDFPVNVTLFFPTELEHNFEMKSYEVFVKENKTQCTATTTQMSEDCLPENKCITMVCKSFNLEKYSAAEFTLLGKAHFRDLEQKPANLPFLKKYTGDSGNVEFVSSIHVGYDNDRFVLESLKQKVEVQFDFIIPPNKLLIISTGVSLGLMLLIVITVVLFKLGCFKRRKLTYNIQRERTKATENVKETYKSTVISNIQVQ
uniref:Integrin alpha-L n=1 Tax=Oreochromis niloticus TaxID=8128 RepID=A0A669BSI0_ORENI